MTLPEHRSIRFAVSVVARQEPAGLNLMLIWLAIIRGLSYGKQGSKCDALATFRALNRE